MNASHSLVLCLNTTGEQPTCSCSTASPLQHQWEGKARWGKREDHCISTSLQVSASGSIFTQGGPIAQGQGEVRGKPKLAAAVCAPLGSCSRGAQCHPTISPSTCEELWSPTKEAGALLHPLPGLPSPTAFCFTRLDMLLTSCNATICSSLSIHKKQQFPSAKVAELLLSKVEGAYRQSVCYYVNTTLFSPLEYLKFLAA